MCIYIHIHIHNTTSGAGGASRGPWLARIDRRAASSLACEWGRKRVVRIQLGSARSGGGAGSIDHRPFRWNNSNANASRRHRGEGGRKESFFTGPAMVIRRKGEISTCLACHLHFENSFFLFISTLREFYSFRRFFPSCNCATRRKIKINCLIVEELN